ncbi:MAG: hypothetical protein ACYDGO_09885 [Smithellaceae bacterium]
MSTIILHFRKKNENNFRKKSKLILVMQMMQHNVKTQKEKSPEEISLSTQREASGTKVREGDLLRGELQAGKGFGETHSPGVHWKI